MLSLLRHWLCGPEQPTPCPSSPTPLPPRKAVWISEPLCRPRAPSYHKPLSAYPDPKHARSQVGIVMRLLLDGETLSDLAILKALRVAGNPTTQPGRIRRYCKAVLAASGVELLEETIADENGKRWKECWVDKADRERLRGA